MSNTLTPMSPTFWSKVMGQKAYKTTVFRALASFSEQAGLSYGLKVDRPYRSNLVVESYTKGTAATAQDLTATSDQLTIDQQKTILMYVDDVDKVQNKWDAAKEWASEAGKRIGIQQDSAFLYEVVNAANTIDDASLGGTAGNGITVTVSNIAAIFGKINRTLDTQNVDMERKNRFWAISPQVYDVLWNYISGKESLLGDKTGEYGNIGRYGGLELYMTNNLTASVVVTPTANPSNTDTLTISGVVFTFVSSIGSTAGNVLQTVSTSQTLTNLAALINTPGTTTANGVAFTGADLRTVQQMVATATATAITIWHKGQSFITASASSANLVFSKYIQHNLAGVKKAIDMVVQLEPELGPASMASTVSAGKRGMNIMPLTVYGVYTFNQGRNEIINVKVNSAATGFSS